MVTNVAAPRNCASPVPTPDLPVIDSVGTGKTFLNPPKNVVLLVNS